MSDSLFTVLMGFLIVMGLLYTFTDFKINPVLKTTDYESPIADTSEAEITRSVRATEESKPEQADIRIQSVHETGNLTTKQEEDARDRNENYKGDEEGEYIIIEAPRDNTRSVNVTGWTLENRWESEKVTIGKARVSIAPGRTDERDITLKPGDLLYIMSGEEPDDWFSAHINICHGYFNSYMKDDLLLPIKNRCPKIDPDLIPRKYQEDEVCWEEIQDQRVCRPAEDISPLASRECKDYIEDLFSYTSCVEQNYMREDFQTGRWMMYLDADDPLWDVKNDGVFLFDTTGKRIDYKGDF